MNLGRIDPQQFASMTVHERKSAMRRRGGTTGGNKQMLLERVSAHVSREAGGGDHQLLSERMSELMLREAHGGGQFDLFMRWIFPSETEVLSPVS